MTLQKHFVIGKVMDGGTTCTRGLMALARHFLGPKFLIPFQEMENELSKTNN